MLTAYIQFGGGGAWEGVGRAYSLDAPQGAPVAPVPLPENSVACTEEQYAAAGPWTTLSAGNIVIGTPPSVTLAEEAIAAIRAGLTIALSGSITLAPTLFPTDPATTGKIAQVIVALNTDGTFPGGATTYPIKDSSGAWHTLTVPQYKAVAAALAGYVAPLDLIEDGNPLGAVALPPNSVALTV